MDELLDPLVIGLIVVNTVMLGVLLAIFRPGPGGYFAGYGPINAWAICFGASVAFTALPLFDIPGIVSIILWWVVALTVFRLTVRQTFKLNIAQGLIYLTLIFGIVAASS